MEGASRTEGGDMQCRIGCGDVLGILHRLRKNQEKEEEEEEDFFPSPSLLGIREMHANLLFVLQKNGWHCGWNTFSNLPEGVHCR